MRILPRLRNYLENEVKEINLFNRWMIKQSKLTIDELREMVERRGINELYVVPQHGKPKGDRLIVIPQGAKQFMFYRLSEYDSLQLTMSKYRYQPYRVFRLKLVTLFKTDQGVENGS